ncbi:hypothetical protein IW262DRAFT_1302759 [Armillaria fumosa]|nr:hypothetical protein IW262DRAFT_1302759 [Armillaria fumosa]
MYFPVKHYKETANTFHLRLTSDDLPVSQEEYDRALICPRSGGIHSHHTCSCGCPTRHLLSPTPAQQAELLKIVQEDKLARSVEGKTKAALTLQGRVNKVKEDLDAKVLRAWCVVFSPLAICHTSHPPHTVIGLHGDKTKAKTAEIKLRNLEEDLAQAKQEWNQSVAASEVLFAVECCTSQQGLEYYLFSKGLTDSLKNSQQQCYTSARTQHEVVSEIPHPSPIQSKDMTVTHGAKIGGIIMADLGLLVGSLPFTIKSASVDENRDGSDSEVEVVWSNITNS